MYRKLTLTSKVKIVNSIPGSETISTRGKYKIFWKGLMKTPKNKFLEVIAKPKEQKLIANYIYFKARQGSKRSKASIVYRPTAMYCFWK
jgi:hypothetical protein